LNPALDGHHGAVSGPVIAGVDDSPEGRDALALAARLARPLEVPVLAAHVLAWGPVFDFHMQGTPADVRATFASALEDATASGRKAVERLIADAGVDAEARFVTAGSAAAGLHGLAEELDAGLIALGRSRRSGVGKVFPGRTAQQLLSGAPSPVAIAPEGYAATDPALGRLACAVDAGAQAFEAVAWAADLALRLGVSLEVISVHRTYSLEDLPMGRREEVHELHGAMLDDILASLGDRVEASATLLDGEPAEELGRVSGRVDLMVLGSRGYGPLRAVLLGSDSTAIVESLRCPAVVVPRGSEVPARTRIA
jgi:nucleotide-binding universal stress UspA family protein